MRSATFKNRSQNRKHDNTNVAGKISVRRALLDAMKIEDPTILDLYAGDGTMWHRAWGKPNNYMGVDTRRFSDPRKMLVADNVRLARHIDFDPLDYDVWDLDAYNHPFYPLLCFMRRIRPPYRVGVVITVGLGLAMSLGRIDRRLTDALSMTPIKGGKLMRPQRKTVIQQMISRACDGATVEPCAWASQENKGNTMDYISFIVSDVEGSASDCDSPPADTVADRA